MGVAFLSDPYQNAKTKTRKVSGEGEGPDDQGVRAWHVFDEEEEQEAEPCLRERYQVALPLAVGMREDSYEDE